MAHTNSTPNYELPQFVGSDILNPLTDLNGAFSDIDTDMKNIADAAGAAGDGVTALGTRMNTAEGKITALETQNGTEVLTTTAQTLSGAINEIDAEINTANTGILARVNTLSNDINNESTGLKVKVNALEEADTAIETKIGNGTLDTVAQNLIGAVNEVNEIANRNSATIAGRYFVFLGDSYAEVLDEDKNFFQWTAQYLGLSASQYKQYHQSGIGFTDVNSHGTFLQLLQTNASQLAADADKITDIVVCGGANDYGNMADTKTAISAFVTYVKSTYPNAVVSIAHVGRPTATSSAISNALNKSLPAYKACGQYGAKYLHNTQFLLHDTRNQSDGNHPNATGIFYMAIGLSQALLSGSCDARYTLAPTWTFNSDQTTYSAFSIDGSIYEEIDNDVASFVLRQGNSISLTLAETGANTALPVVKIATPNHKLMFGGGANDYLLDCMAIAHANGTVVGVCPAGVGLDDNGDLSIFIKNAYRTADFATVTGFYITTVGRFTCSSDRC